MPHNETLNRKARPMLKNKFEAVKNHVYTNRAKYAVGTTLAVVVAVSIRENKMLNEFLLEHDLFDKYYGIPELES